jgi:diguanylate cyclase (GGDEF)-like protein
MLTNQRRSINLAVYILLPLLAAISGMTWTTFNMLQGISTSVDKLEDQRTLVAVKSSVTTTSSILTGLIKDNANWDEPVIHTYNSLDENWVYEMWGKSSADTNYDFVFVLDANGKNLSSYVRGKKREFLSEQFFGAPLKLILEALPSDKKHFSTVSSLLDVQGQLAVIAAAPILPQDSTLAIAAEKPNILIFGRYLTPAILKNLSNQFSVDDLSIAHIKTADSNTNFLTDHWGNAVATATWSARHPGDEARNKYSSSAFALILCLCCAMVPVTVAHYKAITNLKRKERAAFHEARHDKLSGLPNRTFLNEKLDEVCPTQNVSLIYLDLDGFKHVNDSYGHEVGDKLICLVSTSLSDTIQDRGFLTRLGGDEFAILISGIDASKKAGVLATEILQSLTVAFNIEGRHATVGVSIGIANDVMGNTTKSEMMRRADIAMYAAKTGGRNQICWFDADLDFSRHEDDLIAEEMLELVEKGDFDIAYQPIIDAKTRKIAGVEALARWPQSSNRKLTPDRFIKVAEENGIIDQLGMLILKKALYAAKHWKGLSLSVNVSPLQLNNIYLTAEIIALAKAAEFEMQNLILEITESSLIKNPTRAQSFVRELKAQGARIALDDFGTGYASVGYLREFQFDKIKLDKTLTQNILSDISTQKIVQGTVLIAKGLSAYVVAEGVETEEEAQIMHITGCDYFQGYYFHKPKQSAEITTLLETQNAVATALQLAG